MLPSIVVINLERDTARLDHMRAQLGAQGLAFTRFPAVEGADVPAELSAYFENSAASLTAGEIGCYASHLEICRLVAAGRIPSPLLVLEDDVELAPDFAALLRRLTTALPEGWDIVRLSYPTKRATARVARLLSVFELVRYTQVPTSTGAYLLSRTGAKKFLARRKCVRPVDHDLRRVWAWKLETYGVAPPPVRNDRCGASSIDAMKQRALRKRPKPALDGFSRQLQGVRDFGALRWLALEAVNVAVLALPRGERRVVFDWARTAFADRSRRVNENRSARAGVQSV